MSRRLRKQRAVRQSRELAARDDRPEVIAFGGALEGAERTSRETMLWNASRRSPDQIINGLTGNLGVKTEADARGRDVVTNDGYAQGIVDINRDSIVGSQFRLNSQPNITVLKNEVSRTFDDVWAQEFQEAIEEKFNLLAESNGNWFDASRTLTFTGLVRLAVAIFVYTGEALATGEWIREGGRPFNTALQMISGARLSNPQGQTDTATLRNGVLKNQWGAPVGYYIRDAYPTEGYIDSRAFSWTFVPAEKPWGRRMVIHVKDAIQPAQTRGLAGIVAVLKQMRMTKKFQEITLQNAVINASYAATVESELPSDIVAAALGAGANGDVSQNFMNFIGLYLDKMQAYVHGADNIAVDGAKIPHLFPNTKLNTRPLGTPGGVGTEFEVSLLRHIAAGLGISYEEFANDFSKTNYSSGKASMLKTSKHMMSRKKFVADRFATEGYMLWAEEDLNGGNLPMPRNYDYRVLYTQTDSGFILNPIVKEALFACDWIASGRGQIDELKETQAAILRIKSGLSTWQAEIAKQGGDYRKFFRQLAREKQSLDDLGLWDFIMLSAEKSGAASGQQVMQDNNAGEAA